MNDFDAKLAAHEAGQAKLRWEDIAARLQQGNLTPELAKRIMGINVFTLASRPPEWGQTPNEAGSNNGSGVLAGFRENEGDVAPLAGVLSRIRDTTSLNALRAAIPKNETVNVKTMDGRAVTLPIKAFTSVLSNNGYIGENIQPVERLQRGIQDVKPGSFAWASAENKELLYKDESGAVHKISPGELQQQGRAVRMQSAANGEIDKAFLPAYSPGEINTSKRENRQTATRNIALMAAGAAALPYLGPAAAGGGGAAGAGGTALTTAALPASSVITGTSLAASAPSLLSSILTSAASAAVPAIVGQIAGRGGQRRAEEAMGQVNRAADFGMDIAGRQADMGEDIWNRFKEKYGALEDNITADALKGQAPYQSNANELKNVGVRLDSFKPRRTDVNSSQYGSDPRVESEVGKAVADVRNTYRKNRNAENTRMQQYGIDPNSSRFAGLNRELDLGQAADESATGTRTRAGVSEYFDNRDWGRMGELDNRDLGLATTLDNRDYGRAVGLDERDFSRSNLLSQQDRQYRLEALNQGMNLPNAASASLGAAGNTARGSAQLYDGVARNNIADAGANANVWGGIAQEVIKAVPWGDIGKAVLPTAPPANNGNASTGLVAGGSNQISNAAPMKINGPNGVIDVAPNQTDVDLYNQSRPVGGLQQRFGQPTGTPRLANFGRKPIRGVQRTFAEGGMVEEYQPRRLYAGGGPVEESSHGYGLRPMRQVQGDPNMTDSVPAVVDGREPAALDHGEIIWPRDVSEYWGLKTFNEMVKKARQAMQQEQI